MLQHTPYTWYIWGSPSYHCAFCHTFSQKSPTLPKQFGYKKHHRRQTFCSKAKPIWIEGVLLRGPTDYDGHIVEVPLPACTCSVSKTCQRRHDIMHLGTAMHGIHPHLSASVNPRPLVNPPLVLMDLIITCPIMRSVDKPAQYRSLRRIEWNPCSENFLYNQGCFKGSSSIHCK